MLEIRERVLCNDFDPSPQPSPTRGEGDLFVLALNDVTRVFLYPPALCPSINDLEFNFI